MGWTSFGNVPRGGMPAAVIAALTWKNEAEDVETRVLKSEVVRGNVYAAVERKSRGVVKVCAVVGLIKGASYKLLSEEEGPYYWECPAEILAMLSPTDSCFARAWREKCAGAAS